MNKPQVMTVFFFFLLAAFHLSSEVKLNSYGRIIAQEVLPPAEYSYENGEYFIEVSGQKLIGNSLFMTKNGFLTLVGEHETIPTWLRLYNFEGDLLFFKEFVKVINIGLSSCKTFSIFFDGSSTQVLNHDELTLQSYPPSITFAVNSNGIQLLATADNQILYNESTYSVPEIIRGVFFIEEVPLFVTKHSVYKFEKIWEKVKSFHAEIFDVKMIEGKLHLATKVESDYELYEIELSGSVTKRDEIHFDKANYRIEEPIFAPLIYGEEDYPYPIGNSYAEIQEYGGSPYLHPGVDLLGADFQEVYSVADGYVKAVLTTGGDPYWRVAVSNDNVSTQSKGYLYAHLNQESITLNVGDQVQAGDLLGTLYPWGYYDFTHIHFAKIYASGEQWTGNWWTTENVLYDMINVFDNQPPIFEDALPGSRYAFRRENGVYLDWHSLSGEFDIIVKCYDLANSDWKIDVHDLSFSLHPQSNPSETLYERYSFAFDFDLDTYHAGAMDNLVLNTIYSRDATCYSTGHYTAREYYHLITNSDGESLDENETFDSSQFSDGAYWLKVTARDANLNTTVDSMLVVFQNGNTEADNALPLGNIILFNYPNPFNPNTTIRFSSEQFSPNELIYLEIYNIKGQRVKQFNMKNEKSKMNEVVWDGKDDDNQPVSSGIYLYKLSGNQNTSGFQKMILMK
jgi:hypothetical protein